MKLNVDSIHKRLEFLYDKIERLHDDFPLQKNYILSEIDKNRALLLELEVEQQYKEIEALNQIRDTEEQL